MGFNELSDSKSGSGYHFLEYLNRTGDTAPDDAETSSGEIGHQKEILRWTFYGNIDFEGMWGEDWKTRLKEAADLYGWDYDEAESKPNRIWYLEVVGGSLCTRFEPSPYPFTKIPDVVYRYRDAATPQLWGLGAYDFGSGETEKALNLVSQLTLQALWQAQEPTRFINSASIIRRKDEFEGKKSVLGWSPGRVVPIDGAIRVQDSVFTDRPEWESIQMGGQMGSALKTELQESTGATASLQGMSQSNTATEASIDLRQGERRQGIKAWSIDEQLLAPVVEMIYDMVVTFQPTNKMLVQDDEGMAFADAGTKGHEFVVRVVQNATSSYVTAQLLNNVATNMGDLVNWRRWTQELSKHTRTEVGQALIDDDAEALQKISRDVQILTLKIQKLTLESQLMAMTQGPQTPATAGMMQPGMPVGPGGPPGGPMGAGGPPEPAGGGFPNQGQDENRSFSSPTSESDVSAMGAAQTSRNMNPSTRG
jgi:hypothetical protein